MAISVSWAYDCRGPDAAQVFGQYRGDCRNGRRAGCKTSREHDMVRDRDKRAYLARQAEVGRAYRDVMGKHFPAMSMVVVAPG